MQWIKMRNVGEFDVVQAINLLGASVKENEKAIGMFGSGVKYAIAQLLRKECPLVIMTSDKTFELCSQEHEFRGKTFQVAHLRDNCGVEHKSGITSDFGQVDWTEDWFIFREFYSNCLDENGSIELTDTLECEDGETAVFLPYEEFREFFDNLAEYFVSFEGVRCGSGRMFKRGVFVGKIGGLLIDLNDEDIQITETRTMREHSAKYMISYAIRQCVDVEVWKSFLSSDFDVIAEISLNIPDGFKDDFAIVAHDALESIHPNYMIVPNMEHVIKDASASGYNPIIEPGEWSLTNRVFRRYDSLEESVLKRSLSSSEQSVVDSCLKTLSAVMPESVFEGTTVFAQDHYCENNLGQVNIATREIKLSADLLTDRREVMKTLLHELNHIKSQAGDYDRNFARSYEEILIEILM